MVVDHFSCYVHGGAAIAARRIHDGLREHRVDSRFWYNARHESPVKLPGYSQLDWRPGGLGPGPMLHRLAHFLKRKHQKRVYRRALQGRPAGLESFSDCRQYRPTPFSVQQYGSDIIHLHWVSRFLDIPSFFEGIDLETPVVWTLHDVNPATGGCHYTAGCDAYQDVCRHCPQLGSSGPKDLANQAFEAKLVALRNRNLHAVCNSNWVADVARASCLLRGARSIQVINYGLDLTQLVPRNRAASRQVLGIPENAIVIAFGAENVDNARKGFKQLQEALDLLDTGQPIIGLVFGAGGTPDSQTTHPVPMRYTGFIDDWNSLSAVYSAADMFVIPSLEEACGQTGLEALACETPVVGFNVGGIRDYVRPGVSGMLAETGDARDLARQLAWLAAHPQKAAQMGCAGRELVSREYEVATQTRKYVQLYESLLAEAGRVTTRQHAA